MSLKFIFGPSGAGKSRLLYEDIIRRAEADKKKNFLIIVPDQFTMQTQKDLSAEQLPVTQKITYLLDGKEMTPEELAGKSGRVTIRFDYTNNEKVEATIDGKKEQICVPFMAVSGMVLDESFRNIEVTNGKVVADGNNSVVFGYALPGLSDSLDVDEEDFDGEPFSVLHLAFYVTVQQCTDSLNRYLCSDIKIPHSLVKYKSLAGPETILPVITANVP